jgi:hypothetical protein
MQLGWAVVLKVRLAKPKTVAWRPNRIAAQLPTFGLEQRYELMLLVFAKWHSA